MLTTSDVEHKTFSTALRGYDLDEVDDFLDEVVATIKELSEQLEAARAASDSPPPVVTPVAAPEPELQPEPELEPVAAPPPPDIDESAIGRALIAAQTAADKLLEEAQSEAGRIVDDARGEADSWSAERDAKRREAQAEMAALASRVASVRSELSVLAGEVSEKLDDMNGVIEGSVDATGADNVDDGDDQSEPHDQASVGWDGDPGDQSSETGEPSTSDEAGNGSDHLDDILNGVANDLQLGGEHEGQTDDPDEDE